MTRYAEPDEDRDAAEILRVETGHMLLSWPVGAPPDAAERRWVVRRYLAPEGVGARAHRPNYVGG